MLPTGKTLAALAALSRRRAEDLIIPAALAQLISLVTVASADDGETFTKVERLNVIRALLRRSRYRCWANLPLAKLYAHQRFDPTQPFVLVSCHIDALYKRRWYYVKWRKNTVRGTFDNSVCNALLVYAMLADRLPHQVLIAFTGDEERDQEGVEQAIDHLRIDGAYWNLELVVTLDVTEEAYRTHGLTVENVFVEKHNRHSRLRFDTKRALMRSLAEPLPGARFYKGGEMDESKAYAKHDLNCFSLCLPCRAIGDDIHDEEGVAIKLQSLRAYLDGLVAVLRHAVSMIA